MTVKEIVAGVLYLVVATLGCWLVVMVWSLPSVWGRPLAVAGAIFIVRRLAMVIER